MTQREREGKKMKCMLFPGSIINTVINEQRDHGSTLHEEEQLLLAREMMKCDL